jgi:hypothetical protein
VVFRFLDNEKGKGSPFSIQNIAEIGIKYDKKPGQWYGPATITNIFEELNDKYSPIRNLAVITFGDGVMYEEKILSKVVSKQLNKKSKRSKNPEGKEEEKEEICEEEKKCVEKNIVDSFEDEMWTKGIIVFVAFRLGLSKINSDYYSAIKRVFSNPFCMGFIGNII